MKKSSIIMISITIAFLFLVVGFFAGRTSRDGYIHVHTQKTFRREKIVEEKLGKNYYININSASKEELQELPGIGATTADLIIEYREEHGKFKEKKDIMNVKGIGEKTYNEIESMICVEDNG